MSGACRQDSKTGEHESVSEDSAWCLHCVLECNTVRYKYQCVCGVRVISQVTAGIGVQTFFNVRALQEYNQLSW